MIDDKYTDPFEPMDEDKLSLIKDWTIPVPMSEATLNDIDKVIKDYTKKAAETMAKEDVEAAVTEFKDNLRSIYIGHWLRGEYSKLFTAEESHFTQTIDSDNGPIRIQGQSIGNKNSTTGASAVIALQSMIGVGRPTKIPLWHSGVVLTLANFKESEILSLNHTLNESRMELGYRTQGMLFSGGDVNLVMEIVDFVLNHVIASNVKDWLPGDRATLKELILVSDIPSLLAGALESIYPNGYPTEHHCINTECNYKGGMTVMVNDVEFTPDSMLRFNRTVWVDNKRVGIEAKRHMSAPMGTHSKEDILKYQGAFNTTDNLSEVINYNGAQIRFSYHQPTIKSFEEIGLYWIAGVIDMVDSSMSSITDSDKRVRAKKRHDFIRNYQTVLRFQKEAPWIKSIQFGRDLNGEEEDYTVITEIKTIFGLMEELSQNNKLVDDAVKQLSEYKTKTQVSFTGIPNFKCPSCGTTQAEGEESKHSLIPTDMVNYFFTIMVWRLARIGSTPQEI